MIFLLGWYTTATQGFVAFGIQSDGHPAMLRTRLTESGTLKRLYIYGALGRHVGTLVADLCPLALLSKDPDPTVARTVPAIHREQRASNDWFNRSRSQALEVLATRAVGLRWNRRLLEVLLDELCIDDAFVQLVGEPQRIPKTEYPQAVAVALLLRHSWRPDDLSDLAKQIGLVSPTKRSKKPHSRNARKRMRRSRG